MCRIFLNIIQIYCEIEIFKKKKNEKFDMKQILYGNQNGLPYIKISKNRHHFLDFQLFNHFYLCFKKRRVNLVRFKKEIIKN